MHCSVALEARGGAELVHVDVMTRPTREVSGVVKLPLEFRGNGMDKQRLRARVVLAIGGKEVSLGQGHVGELPELVEGSGHGAAESSRVLGLSLALL